MSHTGRAGAGGTEVQKPLAPALEEMTATAEYVDAGNLFTMRAV